MRHVPQKAMYVPRRPTETVLYQTVKEYWPKFCEELAVHDKHLPAFVEKEFEAYLKCGLLEYGYARCVCEECGAEHKVGYSCKRRGFCSSCAGRRMEDTAKHLVDSVLPKVPIRQWVMTVPWKLRTRLGYDRDAMGVFVRSFAQALSRRYKHMAKRALGVASVDNPKTGGLTFVQRFDSALRLNPHLHVLMLDGVYVDGEFVPLPAPTEAELLKIAHKVSRKVLGHLGEEDVAEPEDDSVMPYLAAASAQGKIAMGHHQGHGQMRLVGSEPQGMTVKPRIEVNGFSVFADSRVPAEDKRGRYRLCRYLSRPPVATKRLRRYRHSTRAARAPARDGKLIYKLKRRWADGTEAVIFEPLDLIARLCALVPPPRFHLLRYQGVLAAHASLRSEVVPNAAEGEGNSAQLQLWNDDPPRLAAKRTPWAKLLARVFKVDVTICPSCGGPMNIIEFVDAEQASGFSRAPPTIASAIPQLSLPFAG